MFMALYTYNVDGVCVVYGEAKMLANMHSEWFTANKGVRVCERTLHVYGWVS